METLIQMILEKIKDHPEILDMDKCSLKVLEGLGISWMELNVITRGQMIEARQEAVKRYNQECYMIRVKFGFEEGSYDALLKLSVEQGVSTAEIMRRALQLYASLNKKLKAVDHVIVNRDHLA